MITWKIWAGSKLPPVLAVIVCYLAATTFTLTSPRYQPIGDEGLFYEHATAILEWGAERPFSQDGVYGFHPVLNSVYTASVMWIFGGGEFGWKMSGVISVLLAGVGCYVLARLLFNHTVGLIAIGVLLASHYLFALVHIGYNNPEALPPVVWTVICTVVGIRLRNPYWLAAAGGVMAWGFYVHYGGRLALPMFMATVALMLPRCEWKRTWPALAVFGVGIYPTFLDGGNVVEMWRQVVGGYPQGISGHPGDRILWNLVYNTKAWVHNNHFTHHVKSALLDPASLVLATVGAMRGELLVTFWLALTWVSSAVLSPHPGVAVTRMFIMLPPLALLAGIGGELLVRHVPEAVRQRLIVALLLGMAWVNLYLHI